MENNNIHYSVLMSVYYKENPDWLRKSMESIWNQTKTTDDFVLVCDGPLNDRLDHVIHDMECSHPNSLNVIRLRENVGLGKALNNGLHYCKNDLVARMDSDDISRSDRCEKQLEVFKSHPDFSICSGIVEEFSITPDHVDSLRVPPEKQEDILAYLKKRNPFNHPCVMYRKSAVDAAGGYQDFYLLEDYYLWIRMLKNGCIGYNIQQPLLWMRGGSKMYKRRGGWKYVKSQIALGRYMKDNKIITNTEYIMLSLIRLIFSLLPNSIRKRFFKLFLRRSCSVNIHS